jgi:hypothetical protein
MLIIISYTVLSQFWDRDLGTEGVGEVHVVQRQCCRVKLSNPWGDLLTLPATLPGILEIKSMVLC